LEGDNAQVRRLGGFHVHRVSRCLPVKARRDPRANKVLPVLRALRVIRVLPVLRALRVIRVRPVLPALPVRAAVPGRGQHSAL
jgi:hypothetical protein